MAGPKEPRPGEKTKGAQTCAGPELNPADGLSLLGANPLLINSISNITTSMLEPFLSGSKCSAESETHPPCADTTPSLPIHFFTIVLNGEPFIRHHIEVLRQLPFKWHWHIIEGLAKLTHCTAWSLKNGAQISPRLHKRGRSNDGTTEYLDQIEARFPANITIYRKPLDAFWDGKIEMVQAPLQNIKEECLLWQIDADELWLTQQIVTMRKAFLNDPTRTAAYFFCHYFMAPNLVITTRNTYGNQTSYEWLRVWRFKPGANWVSHEPPVLCLPDKDGNLTNLADINPFRHRETEALGLVFQHYAYATEAQLKFKELYYGYKGARKKWREMQSAKTLPLQATHFFSWIRDYSAINHYTTQNIYPIARRNIRGEWRFENRPPSTNAPKEVLYVRSDAIGDAILSASMLPYLRQKYSHARITVVCQEELAPYYKACPFVDNLLCFKERLLLCDERYRNEVLASISEIKADLALNPVYSAKSYTHLLALASKAPARIAIAGDGSNIKPDEKQRLESYYTQLLPARTGVNELQHHEDFLRGLGLTFEPLRPLFWTLDEDEKYAADFFSTRKLNPEKTIALFAGAQVDYRSCTLIGRALIEICAKQGFSIIALGSDDEHEINQQNCEDSLAPFFNLCGLTSLRQSAALLKRCRLAVGVETSLAQMACALGVPNVIIIGGGHFGRFLPYSSLTSLVCLPLHCYHCNWGCRYAEGPFCLNFLHPATIEVAVRETLSRSTAQPRIFAQTTLPERAAGQVRINLDPSFLQVPNATIIPVNIHSNPSLAPKAALSLTEETTSHQI